MVLLRYAPGRFTAVATLSWLLIGSTIGQPLQAAGVGESAPHRCAGCATGDCRPNGTTFGYYPTRWRKWPFASTYLGTGGRTPAAGTPDAEVPDALDENRYRGRTRSAEPLDPDRAPSADAIPSGPDRPDTNVPPRDLDDPFQTVPESEAPDFQLPEDDAGQGLFDDLEDDSATPPFLEPPTDAPSPTEGESPGLPDADDFLDDLDLPFESGRLDVPAGPGQDAPSRSTTPGLDGDSVAIFAPVNQPPEPPTTIHSPRSSARSAETASRDGSLGATFRSKTLLSATEEDRWSQRPTDLRAEALREVHSSNDVIERISYEESVPRNEPAILPDEVPAVDAAAESPSEESQSRVSSSRPMESDEYEVPAQLAVVEPETPRVAQVAAEPSLAGNPLRARLRRSTGALRDSSPEPPQLKQLAPTPARADEEPGIPRRPESVRSRESTRKNPLR